MNIDLLNTLKNNSVNHGEATKGISEYIKNDTDRKLRTEDLDETSEGVKVGSVAVQMQSPIYGNPNEEEKTIADQMEEGETMSPSVRKNQLAVLANTTTPEDLAEMEKDGFSLEDTDSATIVTVTDQIKANIVKAGGTVEGDLPKEVIEELAGNEYLANQLAQAFAQKDIPITEENVSQTLEAVNMASDLSDLTKGQELYMVKNGNLPTIENLYMAEHSAGISKELGDIDLESIADQVAGVIEEAGLSVNDSTKEMAKALLDNGIALTADNLKYYSQLEEAEISNPDTEQILDAVTDAIFEGARPNSAVLLDGFSISDQARAAVEDLSEVEDQDIAYCLEKGEEVSLSTLKDAKSHRGETDLSKWEQELSFISAKRVLEETRLSMTTEANLSLLKKGVSIDTKPLEDLVEDLKNQEKSFYETLMKQYDIEPTEEKVANYSNTLTALEELKSAPATVLTLTDEDTLLLMQERAQVQKADYEKAGQEYEKLWTSPRADMGDSIKKAFQNVDDILNDMDMDLTEENRRAIRILAYNKTELNEENVNTIKAKDMEMQRAFANLTPRTTLELIRRNENPLDMSLSELAQTTEEISAEIGDDGAEKFSRYLYKLEQNSAISEEERSAYIGIYRLIAQVEKDDGAALGAAVNQGSDLTMRNLLTQIRNDSHKNKDYKIDDAFDGVDAKESGIKIDRQIEAAFQNNCVKEIYDMISPENVSSLTEEVENSWLDLTPEQLLEEIKASIEEMNQSEGAENQESVEENYLYGQLEELQDAAGADQRVFEFLNRMDLPNSVGNILAVQQMMAQPSAAVSTIWNAKDALKEAKEILLERFAEHLEEPTELADALETLADVAEHAMDGMIMEDPAVRQVDVKAMQLASKQITIATKQTKEENFVIPMETGTGVTGVKLTVVRGKENKGLVDILFESKGMGKVSASFEAKANGISGLILTDDEETRQLFADQIPGLAQSLAGEEGEAVDLQVVRKNDLSLEEIGLKNLNRRGEGQNSEEKDPVQTARLYKIAKSFISFASDFA